MAHTWRYTVRAVIFPVQADERLCVIGFPNNKRMRIGLPHRCFIQPRDFYDCTNRRERQDGEYITCGPLEITTRIENGQISLEVGGESRDGEKLAITISPEATKEIRERLDAMRSYLHTYKKEEDWKPSDHYVANATCA